MGRSEVRAGADWTCPPPGEPAPTLPLYPSRSRAYELKIYSKVRIFSRRKGYTVIGTVCSKHQQFSELQISISLEREQYLIIL